MGRWLVLGGTAWLGREVARTAVERGHDVTCLARGESGGVVDGVRWVRADRDGPGAYDEVVGPWDAVVDVARQPGHVRSALAALGETTGRWTFVSTGNVYADLSGPLHEDDALREPATTDVVDAELYGEGKVACERAVLAHPAPLVLRSGLLAGPVDPSDRFGYWPARFSHAGTDDVLVPDPPAAWCQVADVRDVATFVVDATERGVIGVLNVAGEGFPLGEVLLRVADTVGFAGRLVPLGPERLEALDVRPWSGERSLPLWLPEGYGGMMRMDTDRAEAAGLVRRPLEETVADVLADERARGLDRPRAAGLTREEERAVLADATA
ncbi:MAG: oxidoreductase [Propionibacteriales bacterium]|nr:oxidoreductase [Propionibacteriales bacterium]